MPSSFFTEWKGSGFITQKEVNAVFDGQVALCREILQKKTKEYTGNDTDRLGAFKAAAALQHTTPERALAECWQSISFPCMICALPMA